MVAGRDEIEDYLMTEVLFPYEDEIREEREQDAEVKERYGLSSLDTLIAESNQKLMEYYARQDDGDDMQLPIQNEERNLERLERRKEKLEEEIELERNVNVEEPDVFGIAAFLPVSAETYDTPDEGKKVSEDESSDYSMQRNEEIEEVGMKVARAYEEEQGWQVEDVSDKDHGGFDLRSLHFDEDGAQDGIRYIEVKARAQSGKIRLTSNEWKKARKFGDQYWIYIVTEAASDSPQLTRIQNPAQQFEEGEDIRATGFEIQEDAWRQIENAS
jgi:hypothetical protein